MITEHDVVSVTPEDWWEACASFATADAEGRSTAVDWLTAIDRGASVDVLVCLVAPGSGDCSIISCRLDGESPRIASLVDLFPGADWHERETAEMFGIEFVGRQATEPLLLRRGDHAPLRKSSPLEARLETPWPGTDPVGGRRRRKLPPGVRSEWVDEHN